MREDELLQLPYITFYFSGRITTILYLSSTLLFSTFSMHRLCAIFGNLMFLCFYSVLLISMAFE